MWHVYVSSVCVCAHKPLLSPTSTRRVRRSRPLKDSSRQPQYRLPKYNCSWESSSICLSLPLFPFSSRALSSLGNENLSLNLQTDGLCKYYGDMIQVCRNAPELQYLLSNQWKKLWPLTNNNHQWLISIRMDDWLNVSALIQNHGRIHSSKASRPSVVNWNGLINEPVIFLVLSCASSFESPPPPVLTFLKKKKKKNGFIPYMKLQLDAPSHVGSIFLLLWEALRPRVCFTPRWPTSTKNEDNSLAQRHVCLM